MSPDDGQTAGLAPGDAGNLNQLIAAAGRREDHAFDQVFTQLNGPIFRMALAIVRDVAQAEEVAQEAMTEIWRTAGRFDSAKSSALAWALMIARRRAIDRVRSVTADASRARRTADFAVPWDQVSEAVQDAHERQTLRSKLDTLSDDQRRAILLVFDDDHTIAEAAAILAVPVGTVKSRIRAAMINLRRSMHADA